MKRRNMTHMKQQEKSPEKEWNEMEAMKVPDEEFLKSTYKDD